jgi:hypothetical protein
MIVAQHAKCRVPIDKKRKSPAKGRLEVLLDPSEYLLLRVRMCTSSTGTSKSRHPERSRGICFSSAHSREIRDRMPYWRSIVQIACMIVERLLAGRCRRYW